MERFFVVQKKNYQMFSYKLCRKTCLSETLGIQMLLYPTFYPISHWYRSEKHWKKVSYKVFRNTITKLVFSRTWNHRWHFVFCKIKENFLEDNFLSIPLNECGTKWLPLLVVLESLIWHPLVLFQHLK